MVTQEQILKAIYNELKNISMTSHKSYEILKDINFKMIDKVNELDLTDAFNKLQNINETSIDDLEKIKATLKKKLNIK